MASLEYLTRFDSTHGRFPGDVRVEGEYLHINDHRIKVLRSAIPEGIDWAALDVDLVQEMHVNRVSAKGESEIAAKTVSGSIVMNGQPFATPDNKPFLLNYDAHGNITAIKGLAPQAAFGGLLGSGEGVEDFVEAGQELPAVYEEGRRSAA